MTTFYPFVPSLKTAQQFFPTFDDNQYTCSIRWNLFGQRFFVLCEDGAGNVIFNIPLVGSPTPLALSAISWSAASLRVSAMTLTPHGLKLGTAVRLVIDACNPTIYNGAFECWVDSPNSFFYTLNAEPDQLITLGNVSFIINLIKGYFLTSTMVYRNGKFEVNP